MSAISVWMKCDGCGAEGSILLHSPIDLLSIDLTVDRLALREGWVIRRPAGKPPVQVCPVCHKEGKI